MTKKSPLYALTIRDNMVAGRRAIAGFEEYDALANMDISAGTSMSKSDAIPVV